MSALAERNGFNTAVLVLAGGIALYGASILEQGNIAGTGPDMLGAASVSISAGVAPNPINTLAAQLQAKETDLDRREADIAAREAQSSTGDTRAGMISLVASMTLFALVGINFYLDRRRWRQTRRVGAAAGEFSVDLR